MILYGNASIIFVFVNIICVLFVFDAFCMCLMRFCVLKALFGPCVCPQGLFFGKRGVPRFCEAYLFIFATFYVFLECFM